MAASKSQKIQAEIEKVKAKINEQQARLKELEKNKLEAENSEIVDIVRGLSISLEELPLVLQQLREGTSGQSVQKSGPMPATEGKEEN
jgi:septal ring factor EnvC (AmiA/AmiB activator)